MQILEKILEEIEERVNIVENIPVNEDDDFLDGEECYEDGRVQGRYEELVWCRGMIHSHMDDTTDISDKDDWIPVEERLQEESGYYMACIYNKEVDDYDLKNAWFAHADDYNMDESEWRELYGSERVTAWRPLPKPYKPKKDISASGKEHIMSRFMKVE